MKFLEFLSTFLSQSLSFLSPNALIDQIFERFQKVLKTLIILFICTIMSCVTLAYLIDRFLNQLDAGEFVLSRSIILLVLLLIGFCVTLTLTLKSLNRKQAEARKSQELQRTESALEAALAALVLDFVKEREEKRATAPVKVE
ncbi:MAG: hypothetical protein V4598_06435 [Bdellovibrionota bacterium]